MKKQNESDRLVLLEMRVKVLEAENAVLTAELDAYDDFTWAVLGMFSEKNMQAFKVWFDNVNKAIDALPNSGKIREVLEAK